MRLSTLAFLGVFSGSSLASTQSIPEIYQELSALPVVYRRAAFRHLDPEIQRDLWLHHTRRYRIERRGLNHSQYQTLANVEAAVLRAFGVDEDSLKDEVIEAFGESEAMNIIATLGPPDSKKGRIPQQVLERRGDLGRCSAGPECNCHRRSTDCRPCGEGASCVSSPTGCGFWWREPCDGI
jgi:hypothetical protein